MLSTLATVKVAVEICNGRQLKREILCVPGSDYYENKSRDPDDRRKQWHEIVHKKATIIVQNLEIPEKLHEKVIGVIHSVAYRMLTWAVYHERTLGFLSNLSFNFLNGSVFTSQGIIDLKKAAIALMNDKNLIVKQKYKLALLYCLNEYILDLYQQMNEMEKEEFYDSAEQIRIRQPHFVKFWSYYRMGEIDKLRGETNPDLYWLQKAIQSGCKDTVEYCLENTNLSSNRNILIYSGTEAIRNRLKSRFDEMVFKDNTYDESMIDTWVPSDYYIDIILVLFLKMREDQQREFLMKDIIGRDYEDFYYNNMRSNVLKYFLDWPYQDYFMKIARLTWEFLPERSYAYLSRCIVEKIESSKYDQKYGEGKTYDYRKIFKQFWNESPERNKINVFRDSEIIHENGEQTISSTGKLLLKTLFGLKNLTIKDRKIVELILNNATKEEKEKMLYSKAGATMCMVLMANCRWITLHAFVANCLVYKRHVERFIRMFSCSNVASSVCYDFIMDYKWYAVETFFRWSSLSEETKDKLKKTIINSDEAMDACAVNISHSKNLKALDKTIRCFLHTECEVTEFKRKLLFSSCGMNQCANLVTGDQVELANEFINWILSSRKEIRNYKEHLGNTIGCDVCVRLISRLVCEDVYGQECDYFPGCSIKFDGGKWEEVEKFLTWCFSSKDKIGKFKRNNFDIEYFIEVQFNLIDNNKWEDADMFFTWLGFSSENTMELKKGTSFSLLAMHRINFYLHKDQHEGFLHYAGGKWELIELFLRWSLVDEEAVLEFRNVFDEVYGFKRYDNSSEELSQFERINLNRLYLLVEKLLNNLHKTSETTERKYEFIIEEFPDEDSVELEQ